MRLKSRNVKVVEVDRTNFQYIKIRTFGSKVVIYLIELRKCLFEMIKLRIQSPNYDDATANILYFE